MLTLNNMQVNLKYLVNVFTGNACAYIPPTKQ